MIVCPEPLAARAGQDVFAAGGNAVDASVATAFAQGVVNPLLCGIGGTALIYHYDGRRRRGTVLNAEVSIGSRPVPAAWASEYAGRAETIGRYILRSEANQVGYQSVMTPGFVRGWWDAYRRFGSGKLSWSELLQPAIQLARDGFEVYPYIAAFWRRDVGGDSSDARPGYPGLDAKFAASRDVSRIYLKPDGSSYTTGEVLKQPEYAAILQRLAEAGGDDFYTGEIARVIAEDFAAHEGLFDARDLRDYRVLDREPIEGEYRGYRITATPPASSGPQFIEMLKTLSHFDVVALGHNTPQFIDIFARIMRASFSDNVLLKGIGVDEGAELTARVTGDERAGYWAERIKRGDRIVVRGGAVDPGTSQLVAIDDQRNAVTCMHSIGSLAGSGVVTPGLGFLFNNFLGHFNPLPGHFDSIAPGKRLGGGVPAMIFKGDEPYIVIGAPGGSRINTSVTQAVVNVLDFGMDMEEAVSVPRFHSEEEQLVFLEPAFPEAIAEELRGIGNQVVRSTYMSRVQAIRVTETGELEAGPDPRGGRGVGFYAGSVA